MSQSFTRTIPIDTDSNLTNNSDFLVASQKAVKAYVDNNQYLGSNSQFIDQSGGTGDTYGVLAGLVNGSNTVFTVSEGTYVSGSLKVYLNGQLQTQGSSEDFTETTPVSGTFTFSIAPQTGDLITVEYLKSLTVTGNADTLDGYHASEFIPSRKYGTSEIDFGASGDIQGRVTINDASITTASNVIVNVRCVATTNNSIDDIESQIIEVKASNILNGSCEIVANVTEGIFNYELPVSYIVF